MFHVHFVNQTNKAFVVNSCPFSGYAGIECFFLYHMLHNFYVFFHSYLNEQNIWPQEFYDANSKKNNNVKNIKHLYRQS